MKIKKISLYSVPLTSHTPYYMADGKACDITESIVAKVESDDGVVGFGEVCPIPHYLPAYAKGVVPAIEELAPVLIGANPLGAEVLTQKCDAYLQGHEYAKSILDIAFWDMTARVAGLPLYALLGGRQVDRMPLYHSITCVAADEMVRIALDAEKQGMTQFQVKLGADNSIEHDIERLIKVREAVGSSHLVYGDFNCGATSLYAIRVCRAVMGLDIMIEQPCATLEDCLRVKEACGLAMKIDENAHDVASLLRAHRLGIMDAVAVKLSKFGGVSESRKARDLCYHLGTEMCIEDVWGSDITTAALLHLGVSTGAKHVMNVCDLSHYVSPYLSSDLPRRDGGYIVAPDSVGLGISVIEDNLGSSISIID